jgi:hypothetical protein
VAGVAGPGWRTEQRARDSERITGTTIPSHWGHVGVICPLLIGNNSAVRPGLDICDLVDTFIVRSKEEESPLCGTPTTTDQRGRLLVRVAAFG